MSFYGRWRFTLRTPFSIFFFFLLTFLPRNLNTQVAEVFDSSQDYSSIQSRVYGNRRSLIETSLQVKASTVIASTDLSPSPPPSSSVPTETARPLPATPLSPPPPSSPRVLSIGTNRKPVYTIVGIVMGVFIVLAAIIIFIVMFPRKISAILR